MKAIKIYTDRHAYVRVPVDEHWINIAQTVRDHYQEYFDKYPDGTESDGYDDGADPWTHSWHDMMAPRYYAMQCVREILGDEDWDFDIYNDYQDLEDTLEALLDGREDAGLVELEQEVA
jgi:hypothetical protein